MTDILQRLRADYCTCHEAYRTRDMLDPTCESCATKDDRTEAADEIERLRDGASRWIPVTERLPEIAATCWVAIEMRYEVITRLAYCERSGNWQHIDARPILSPVLAWQPIIEPEAYKP